MGHGHGEVESYSNMWGEHTGEERWYIFHTGKMYIVKETVGYNELTVSFIYKKLQDNYEQCLTRTVL